MYIDKLNKVILESDYLRISNKFILEIINLIKQKEELQEKLNQPEKIQIIKIKVKMKKNQII